MNGVNIIPVDDVEWAKEMINNNNNDLKIFEFFSLKQKKYQRQEMKITIYQLKFR